MQMTNALAYNNDDIYINTAETFIYLKTDDAYVQYHYKCLSVQYNGTQ